MIFKDAIARDINNTFLNTFEFAETAMVEGVEMNIVMDTTENLQGDKKNQVTTSDLVFHVDSSYFEEIPQSEKIMNFNGKDYFIESVNDHLGILTIGLSRNKS